MHQCDEWVKSSSQPYLDYHQEVEPRSVSSCPCNMLQDGDLKERSPDEADGDIASHSQSADLGTTPPLFTLEKLAPSMSLVMNDEGVCCHPCISDSSKCLSGYKSGAVCPTTFSSQPTAQTVPSKSGGHNRLLNGRQPVKRSQHLALDTHDVALSLEALCLERPKKRRCGLAVRAGVRQMPDLSARLAASCWEGIVTGRRCASGAGAVGGDAAGEKRRSDDGRIDEQQDSTSTGILQAVNLWQGGDSQMAEGEGRRSGLESQGDGCVIPRSETGKPPSVFRGQELPSASDIALRQTPSQPVSRNTWTWSGNEDEFPLINYEPRKDRIFWSQELPKAHTGSPGRSSSQPFRRITPERLKTVVGYKYLSCVNPSYVTCHADGVQLLDILTDNSQESQDNEPLSLRTASHLQEVVSVALKSQGRPDERVDAAEMCASQPGTPVMQHSRGQADSSSNSTPGIDHAVRGSQFVAETPPNDSLAGDDPGASRASGGSPLPLATSCGSPVEDNSGVGHVSGGSPLAVATSPGGSSVEGNSDVGHASGGSPLAVAASPVGSPVEDNSDVGHASGGSPFAEVTTSSDSLVSDAPGDPPVSSGQSDLAEYIADLVDSVATVSGGGRAGRHTSSQPGSTPQWGPGGDGGYVSCAADTADAPNVLACSAASEAAAEADDMHGTAGVCLQSLSTGCDVACKPVVCPLALSLDRGFADASSQATGPSSERLTPVGASGDGGAVRVTLSPESEQCQCGDPRLVTGPDHLVLSHSPVVSPRGDLERSCEGQLSQEEENGPHNKLSLYGNEPRYSYTAVSSQRNELERASDGVSSQGDEREPYHIRVISQKDESSHIEMASQYQKSGPHFRVASREDDLGPCHSRAAHERDKSHLSSGVASQNGRQPCHVWETSTEVSPAPSHTMGTSQEDSQVCRVALGERQKSKYQNKFNSPVGFPVDQTAVICRLEGGGIPAGEVAGPFGESPDCSPRSPIASISHAARIQLLHDSAVETVDRARGVVFVTPGASQELQLVAGWGGPHQRTADVTPSEEDDAGCSARAGTSQRCGLEAAQSTPSHRHVRVEALFGGESQSPVLALSASDSGSGSWASPASRDDGRSAEQGEPMEHSDGDGTLNQARFVSAELSALVSSREAAGGRLRELLFPDSVCGSETSPLDVDDDGDDGRAGGELSTADDPGGMPLRPALGDCIESQSTILKQGEPHPAGPQRESHPTIPEHEPHIIVLGQESYPNIPERESNPAIVEQESHLASLERESRLPLTKRESQSTIVERESHRAAQDIRTAEEMGFHQEDAVISSNGGHEWRPPLSTSSTKSCDVAMAERPPEVADSAPPSVAADSGGDGRAAVADAAPGQLLSESCHVIADCCPAPITTRPDEERLPSVSQAALAVCASHGGAGRAATDGRHGSNGDGAVTDGAVTDGAPADSPPGRRRVRTGSATSASDCDSASDCSGVDLFLSDGQSGGLSGQSSGQSDGVSGQSSGQNGGVSDQSSGQSDGVSGQSSGQNGGVSDQSSGQSGSVSSQPVHPDDCPVEPAGASRVTQYCAAAAVEHQEDAAVPCATQPFSLFSLGPAGDGDWVTTAGCDHTWPSLPPAGPAMPNIEPPLPPIEPLPPFSHPSLSPNEPPLPPTEPLLFSFKTPLPPTMPPLSPTWPSLPATKSSTTPAEPATPCKTTDTTNTPLPPCLDAGLLHTGTEGGVCGPSTMGVPGVMPATHWRPAETSPVQRATVCSGMPVIDVEQFVTTQSCVIAQSTVVSTCATPWSPAAPSSGAHPSSSITPSCRVPQSGTAPSTAVTSPETCHCCSARSLATSDCRSAGSPATSDCRSAGSPATSDCRSAGSPATAGAVPSRHASESGAALLRRCGAALPSPEPPAPEPARALAASGGAAEPPTAVGVDGTNGGGRRPAGVFVNTSQAIPHVRVSAGEAVTPVGEAGTPVSEAVTPVGEAVTPVGRAVTPVGRAVTPVGEAVIPVGRAVTPVGRVVAPVGGVVTPVGGAVTPVGGAVIPVGGAVTPVGANSRYGDAPASGRPSGRAAEPRQPAEAAEPGVPCLSHTGEPAGVPSQPEGAAVPAWPQPGAMARRLRVGLSRRAQLKPLHPPLRR